MNRKTLIGLILIGAILLLWPIYLSLVFPEENTPVAPEKEPVTLSKEKESPSSSSPEKRAPSVSGGKELLTKIQTPLYSAVISNKNGGAIVSFIFKRCFPRHY